MKNPSNFAAMTHITATLAGIAIAPKLMVPLETLETAQVAVETGIQGDARGGKRNRQITILFADDWRDAVKDAGADNLHWTARRANLLLTGMRCPGEAGGAFTIGAVRLEVMLETDPCDVMENTATGLRDALTPHWRGGVSCRVLAGGAIAVGDAVAYHAPAHAT